MTNESAREHELKSPKHSEASELVFVAVKSLVGLATLLVSLAAVVMFAFLAGSSVLAWFAIPLVTSIALMAVKSRTVAALLLAVNISLLIYAGMLARGVLDYHGGR